MVLFVCLFFVRFFKFSCVFLVGRFLECGDIL